MEITIEINDYLSKAEIKEIAEQELRAAFREQFRREADVERVLTNLSLEYVHALVAEPWDGDFDELLRQKVREAIENGVGYQHCGEAPALRVNELYPSERFFSAGLHGRVGGVPAGD